MRDLHAGVAINLIISIALLLLSVRVGRHLTTTRRFIAAIVLLTATIAAYIFLVHDRLYLAKAIPFSGVITLTDAVTPLLACIIGLLLAGRPGQRKVPPLLILVLILAALTHLFRSATGQWALTSQLKMDWRDGVCPQTSDDTTSAASAATLLAACGLSSNEMDMANACLSQTGGTPNLGVYRGLRRATAGKPFQVVVISGGKLDDLRAVTASKEPVLISVGLPLLAKLPPGSRFDNWMPGTRHMLVLFGLKPNGKLDIGDPSVGRTEWDEADLNAVWNGEALYLSRQGSP